MSDLLREAGRKAFHMLSLAYLAAYHLLGYPRILAWMAAWSAFVVAAETARFSFPRANDQLVSFFGSLGRPEERGSYSGIFHTTLGALVAFVGFGASPRLVSAGIACVALGDAAAALAGKAWGRHRLPGGRKSVEGSLACLLVCVGICLLLGFSLPASFLAGLAATAVEACPTTRWFNDNLWMPAATAAVLALCAGS